MAYTGYYTEQQLRDRLGNTIGANFSQGLLEDAREYGDDKVDTGTQKQQIYQDVADTQRYHSWTPADRFFGLVKGISMEFATAFVRSTQINVSIQALREYQQAEQDLKDLYALLVSLGLVNVGGRIHVDQFVTDVLNPISGTRVTGLRGIVPSRRMSWEESLYHP